MCCFVGRHDNKSARSKLVLGLILTFAIVVSMLITLVVLVYMRKGRFEKQAIAEKKELEEATKIEN